MTTPDPTPIHRHLRPSPAWLIVGLLVVEGLLLLSERYRWFWFNEKKGWAVLVCVAVLGVAMLVMLGWFVVSLIFRWRFQFGIRSLLVLVVVVAIPCSWLVVERERELNRWRDAIRSSMCEESEKKRLLIWLNDPSGIALLRHLSIKEATDGEKTYHAVFIPMFNGIKWKGTFTDAATGAKRQVLLYSSSGFRPMLTTIVVIDQNSDLVQWAAPSIGADVAQASIRKTEAGVELILDAYTMGLNKSNKSRGIYRFALRNDGIAQLDVKWCNPDYDTYFTSGRHGGVIEVEKP
jgi:hypothetical protein